MFVSSVHISHVNSQLFVGEILWVPNYLLFVMCSPNQKLTHSDGSLIHRPGQTTF